MKITDDYTDKYINPQFVTHVTKNNVIDISSAAYELNVWLITGREILFEFDTEEARQEVYLRIMNALDEL